MWFVIAIYLIPAIICIIGGLLECSKNSYSWGHAIFFVIVSFVPIINLTVLVEILFDFVWYLTKKPFFIQPKDKQ